MTEEEGAAQQRHGRQSGGRECYGVGKVDVSRTTLSATEENDIHAERSRKLESMAIDRLSVTGPGPRRTTATDEMLRNNLFILATPLSWLTP
jgi:hypothetical protein